MKPAGGKPRPFMKPEREPNMSDPIAKIIFDTNIAMKVSLAEERNSRALGCSWVDSYNSGFEAMESVMELAYGPMPATVLTRFRP